VEPVHPNGSNVLSVVIENDFQDSPVAGNRPRKNRTAHAAEGRRSSRKPQFGMAAAFPSHVKVSTGLGKWTRHHQRVGGESYITSYSGIWSPYEILDGIDILLRLYGWSAPTCHRIQQTSRREGLMEILAEGSKSR
jgi:electron transport complex protein RnfC